MPTRVHAGPVREGSTGGGPSRRSDFWIAGLVSLGSLATFVLGGLAVLGHPGLPYNVRELIPSGRPGVTLGLLGLCLIITGAAPLLLAWSWDRRPAEFAWTGPLNGVAVAILVYSLLMGAVPLESIHDIVGSPVLGISDDLEYLGRFVGLYLGILVGLTMGARLTIGRVPGRRDLPGLLGLSAAAGLSALVVVRFACTDNIVELLRGEGSGAAPIVVMGFTCVLGLAAGAFSLGIVRAAEGRWRTLAGGVALSLMALLAGWVMLVAATNPSLTKYGRTFAARQFLFSPDRDHYLGDGPIFVRFAIADFATIAVLSIGMLIGRLVVRARRVEMSTRPATAAAAPLVVPPPRREHFALMSLAFVAFVIYGSLVPLQPRAVPLGEAWQRFRNIPFLELGIQSRSDWVANILLFVPLGFLLTGTLCVDRPDRFRYLSTFAIVVSACALLSAAVEFTQIWFPPRTVSQNDIVAETLGSVAGIALWALAGRRLTAAVRDHAATLSPRRKFEGILQAYMVGLLFYSVLPLDLTINPAHLWRKYHEGRILLFAIGDGPLAESAYVIFAKVVTFVPVGVLIASWFPRHRGGIGGLTWGLAAGGLLSSAIECAQLLVYSRITNGADILWGALGVGIGVACRGARKVINAPRSGTSRGELPWMWPALAIAYALALPIIFWHPFDFTSDQGLVLDRLSGMARVPFSAMYWGTDWNAMTQVARKVLWFVPLGALTARGIAPVFPRPSPSSRAVRLGIGAVTCLAVAVALELGQVLLPSKIADATDIFLYEAGALIGLLVAARVLELRAEELRARSSPARG